MAALAFTHVTIYGNDVDELVSFYKDIFEMEKIQAPNLGIPIAWLRCGDRQLHVVNRETEPPQYHHFAVVVDDFESVFQQARKDELFDNGFAPEIGFPVFKLPDGAVQMYLRDPAGNLIEVNWPEYATLSEDMKEHIIDRSERHPQSKAQSEASLFFG